MPIIQISSSRIIYIDVKFPRPDRDSASIRAVQFLTFLASHATVDIAVLTDYGLDDSAVNDATAIGVRLACPPGSESIRHYLTQNGADYDVIVLAWSRTATAVMREARAAAPKAFLVFDTVDVNHVRALRQARVTGNARHLRDALRTRTEEVAAMALADLTIAITEPDREVLRALAPDARIETISQWQEPVCAVRMPADRPGILFVGHYQAAPNHDAAMQLANETMPLVLAQIPTAHLCLAGSDPGPDILALASPSISVPGWESDLAPRLATAHVFAAPLRFGAGIKGKMLQAMAWRLPLVASPVAVEGIGLIAQRDYLPADTAAACAEGIVSLLVDPDRARNLAESAASVLQDRFSRAAIFTQYKRAFAAALG